MGNPLSRYENLCTEGWPVNPRGIETPLIRRISISSIDGDMTKRSSHYRKSRVHFNALLYTRKFRRSQNPKLVDTN